MTKIQANTLFRFFQKARSGKRKGRSNNTKVNVGKIYSRRSKSILFNLSFAGLCCLSLHSVKCFLIANSFKLSVLLSAPSATSSGFVIEESSLMGLQINKEAFAKLGVKRLRTIVPALRMYVPLSGALE